MEEQDFGVKILVIQLLCKVSSTVVTLCIEKIGEAVTLHKIHIFMGGGIKHNVWNVARESSSSIREVLYGRNKDAE